MPDYHVTSNEIERLKALAYYGIFNNDKEPDLDLYAETACLICDCPVALIAIMGDDTQYVKSCVGMDIDTVPREHTVCQYTMLKKEVLVVTDTAADDRTANNPLIKEGGIKFYAGYPLLDENGLAIGTICVVDYKPKTLTGRQEHLLQKLADTVVKQFTKSSKESDANYFHQIFGLTQNLICVLDKDGRFNSVNPAFEKLFHTTSDEINGELFWDFFLNINGPATNSYFKKLDQNSEFVTFTIHIEDRKGNNLYIEWNIKATVRNEIFCFGRNLTSEISERLKLENSERKFRNLYENSLGLMSMHDLEGNILSVNKNGLELLQYDEKEIKSRTLFDLIPGVYHEGMLGYLQRIKNNRKDEGMMVLFSKSGERIFWMYNNILETDQDGNEYVVSTALNLTERIALEKDLAHTKRLLEHTGSLAQVGGWEFNLITQKVFWTDLTKEIYGVSPDFVPTIDNTRQLFDEKSRPIIQQSFSDAIKYGKEYDIDVQVIQPNNEKIWVRLKGIPEFEDGTCKRLSGFVQNINDIKNAAIELEKQKAILQTFITYVPATVAMLDSNMNYLAVSKRWCEEFKYADKEFVGKNHYDLFPHMLNSTRKVYEEALAGQPYKNTDQVFNTPNGMNQHYNWEVRPWGTDQVHVGGIIVFAENITESFLRNEELKKAKVDADQANKAKSEFLANMSHEIRTPLNGVIGFSDLLMKTPLNELQKQYLSYINDSGSNLLAIINDILDFSKIESGKFELAVSKANLYEFANQITNVILYQAQRKHIELLLNIEQGLPQYIFVDEPRLKQVLINLLGNAVKFTHEGEIELKIQKISSDANKICLRFSVRDTGIGIAKEKQFKIFDAFTQEDGSVSKKYGGTGLGLAISKDILKYMGSQLMLDSTPGEGSTFTFDLNVEYEFDTTYTDDLSGIQRVLIVDDNEANRVILHHMLQYKNIECEMAANGMEALQILMSGEHFDFILIDYHMPVLSGIETIKKIREISNSQEKTPLILLHSSSEEEELTNKADHFNLNIAQRLLKPIKSDELYYTLRNALKQNSNLKLKPNAASEENDPVLTTDKLNVLIADDNAVNMALNVRIINNIVPRADISSAINGKEAVEFCKTRHYDFILMDAQMPEMNGMEATRAIRQLPGFSVTPIIGITAGNVKGEKEKCLDSGMSDFLTKPIKEKDVYATLKNILSPQKPPIVTSEGHINMQTIDEIVGDDTEFKTEFIGLVIEQMNSMLETIDQYEKNQDLVNLRLAAHKFYGTAATSGLIVLAKLSREIETNTELDKDSIQDKLLKIRTEIHTVSNLLKSMNPANG